MRPARRPRRAPPPVDLDQGLLGFLQNPAVQGGLVMAGGAAVAFAAGALAKRLLGADAQQVQVRAAYAFQQAVDTGRPPTVAEAVQVLSSPTSNGGSFGTWPSTEPAPAVIKDVDFTIVK